MGLAIGDYNLDGNLDIFKTHFWEDTAVLYRNDGKGNFFDVTASSGLAVETRFVSWGTAWIWTRRPARHFLGHRQRVSGSREEIPGGLIEPHGWCFGT
jgi:hypothetical protein